MTFLPRPANRMPILLGRRLRELGQHLAEIGKRVREAVTQAIRETMAQLARDAVDRVLPRRFYGPRVFGERDFAEDHYDPWQDEVVEEDSWTASEVPDDDEPASSSASAAPVGRSSMALALAAASWWLRRQGTLWGAFGVGLVAVALATVTCHWARDSLLLVPAAHDLMTYRAALATFAGT
jgi:hypothetical protein